MPRYVVVVRETVEQTFEVEAENADAARDWAEGLGFGHDGCVDWTDFLSTMAATEDVRLVEENEIARTVRRPTRLR